MVAKVPSRGSDQFVVRLPNGMRDAIKTAADDSGRSMNSEIVARLEESLQAEPSSRKLPSPENVLYIVLDTNGMPISWAEVAVHLSSLTRIAELNTAKVDLSVITPNMVDGSRRTEQLMAVIRGYNKLIDE